MTVMTSQSCWLFKVRATHILQGQLAIVLALCVQVYDTGLIALIEAGSHSICLIERFEGLEA